MTTDMQSYAMPYRLASALHVVPCRAMLKPVSSFTGTRRGRLPLRWCQILLVAAISVSVTRQSKEEARRGDSGCMFSLLAFA